MRKSLLLAVLSTLTFAGCATIANESHISLAFRFSDRSSGACTFENKRGLWRSEIPTPGVKVRRSDDPLVYKCKTDDGREANGFVRSEIEEDKVAASVFFWRLVGITDAITDKHRTYERYVVISVPVKLKQ